MVAYWHENTRPLAAFFGARPLRKIAAEHIAQYQTSRADVGRAPKTINGEIAVLRQLLKAAKLWYRFREDYVAVPNTKPPAGRALTEEEQRRLFDVASRTPRWVYAYTAGILAFYCGLRACEIKALRWKDVDLKHGLIEIRRSKTPAGWRTPTLNRVCLTVLSDLWARAAELDFTAPDHCVFPRHARNHKLDPTRPVTSWRTAWRAMLKAAGLTGVTFHHGRHTAITTLAERGLPDWVIRAQVGHVAPEMMKTYSHITRKALNQAAAALEPAAPQRVVPAETQALGTDTTVEVTSQSASQRQAEAVARH
jgi:integrase